MRRLQLGMWQQWSRHKWEQYSLDILNGLEICHYPDRSALEAVRTFCDAHHIGFGVHGPILGDRGYKLPRLNSPDASERREAMRQVAEEAELASQCGADYILFHYPFLPVFQPPIRSLFPKMPDPSARYGYDRLSRQTFRDVSERLFHELGELQHRLKQRILLEHDFFGDYEDICIDMFVQHPDIQLVVDTARLDITKRAFDGFDPYAWLDKLAPTVYLVHYSNVRYEGDTFTHHLPERHMKLRIALRQESQIVGRVAAVAVFVASIPYEHNPDLVGRSELADIYRRAADVCGIAVKP